MGLPFPPRQRQVVHYFPIFATLLMVSSIISICVWIHYTQTMIFSIAAALDVVGDTANADNHSVLGQSVIATSVLFLIYACIIFGLCLWRALLEAEVDKLGEVKDKLQLYQMANLGVRICWVGIMTWLVLLMAGCAIVGVYIANMVYMVKYTLLNQDTRGVPVHTAPYPDCPATCVDLWVVDYVDVPIEAACVCDPLTLQSVLNHLSDALDGVPGCIAGVMMMYVVGGFWRSELSKHHAAVRKEQDVAARLAASGGMFKAGGGGSAGRGGDGGGMETGRPRPEAGGTAGYRPVATGPVGGRGAGGAGRGRGRGRGREPD